jgi:hypothetical protein
MPVETVLPKPDKERADDAPQHVLAAGPLQTVALRSFILTGLFLLVLLTCPPGTGPS